LAGARRSARGRAAGREHDARQPHVAGLLQAQESGFPLEVVLAEVDRPPETALEGRDGLVVLDAADDEPALDPEQVERVHTDELHALGGQRVDERVPQLECPTGLNPELVAELRRVAEPRHEHRDAGNLDVVAESVIGKRRIRDVPVRERLEHHATERALKAQVRGLVGELPHLDAGRGGPGGEDLVVKVVRAAKAHVIRREHRCRAVVDHEPALVAERAVRDLARSQLWEVAGEQRVKQIECALPGDVHLAEHGEVHEPGSGPHRAILFEGVGHHGRRRIAEQVHPLVGQRGEARVESRFFAHDGIVAPASSANPYDERARIAVTGCANPRKRGGGVTGCR
jgi:hypothetical protein